MRILTLAFLIGGLASAQAAERTVDLDRPGALEAIEKESPAHYRQIVEILRISEVVSCETLAQVLHVQYNVSEAQCSAHMILTSLPPKRHLYFTLDTTGYRTNIVLRGYEGRLVPAR